MTQKDTLRLVSILVLNMCLILVAAKDLQVLEITLVILIVTIALQWLSTTRKESK